MEGTAAPSGPPAPNPKQNPSAENEGTGASHFVKREGTGEALNFENVTSDSLSLYQDPKNANAVFQAEPSGLAGPEGRVAQKA